MSEPTPPIEELGFEQAMQALDTLVSSLESGQLPLEDMVNAYERGMKLLRVCRTRIDSARRRVEAINLNQDGKSQASLSEFAPLDSLIPTPNTKRNTTKSRDKDKDKDSGSDSDPEEIRLI